MCAGKYRTPAARIINKKLKLIARRINALQSNNKIHRQIRLHIIMRLTSAGYADSLRCHRNGSALSGIERRIKAGRRTKCRSVRSRSICGSRSALHKMVMRRHLGSIQSDRRYAAGFSDLARS